MAHDVKEHVPSVEGLNHPQKSNYTSPLKAKATFGEQKSFTPLNTRHEHIWWEVLHQINIPTPPTPKVYVMVPEPGRWCKFHKVKGSHTEECCQLKKKIERMIQEEHLKMYAKETSPQGQKDLILEVGTTQKTLDP